MKKNKKKLLTALLILIITAISFYLFSPSLQRSLDRNGLRKIANEFEDNFEPGNPGKLQNFIDTFDFEKNTIPITPNITMIIQIILITFFFFII